MNVNICYLRTHNSSSWIEPGFNFTRQFEPTFCIASSQLVPMPTSQNLVKLLVFFGEFKVNLRCRIEANQGVSGY